MAKKTALDISKERTVSPALKESMRRAAARIPNNLMPGSPLKSAKTGAKINKTGVVLLHKGERVLNPKQTKKFDSAKFAKLRSKVFGLKQIGGVNMSKIVESLGKIYRKGTAYLANQKLLKENREMKAMMDKYGSDMVRQANKAAMSKGKANMLDTTGGAQSMPAGSGISWDTKPYEVMKKKVFGIKKYGSSK